MHCVLSECVAFVHRMKHFCSLCKPTVALASVEIYMYLKYVKYNCRNALSIILRTNNAINENVCIKVNLMLMCEDTRFLKLCNNSNFKRDDHAKTCLLTYRTFF